MTDQRADLGACLFCVCLIPTTKNRDPGDNGRINFSYVCSPKWLLLGGVVFFIVVELEKLLGRLVYPQVKQAA